LLKGLISVDLLWDMENFFFLSCFCFLFSITL
jgi:hypothetical protein